MSAKTYTKTLKVRVRDKHAKELLRQAREVNRVWNYVNELSHKYIRDKGKFLSAYDIHKYTSGSSKYLGLHSQTIQRVTSEYVTRRRQFKKNRLKWRRSFTHRSLGWIPINTGAATWRNGQVYFHGKYYQVWDSYGLSQYEFRTASFTEDARGRWYFNVVVSVKQQKHSATGAVGIDLGCNQAATTSNNEVLKGARYRELEDKLAVAQRARNKKRVRAIHAKIKNKRNDDAHKFSRKLVDQNALIVVGDVSSEKLVKTKMAKSVLDAGWGQLKTMLGYKCEHAGIVFLEVNESYTTVTCSACKSRTGPQGLEGLRIREWTCGCGVTHSRDVNAAKNILALGHERLAGGIPHLNEPQAS